MQIARRIDPSCIVKPEWTETFRECGSSAAHLQISAMITPPASECLEFPKQTPRDFQEIPQNPQDPRHRRRFQRRRLRRQRIRHQPIHVCLSVCLVKLFAPQCVCLCLTVEECHSLAMSLAKLMSQSMRKSIQNRCQEELPYLQNRI